MTTTTLSFSVPRTEIPGVFAHPEYAQRIKPDSIYEITAIGQSIPFMGVYPRVKELLPYDCIKSI